jgi:hypothetical protein
MLTKKNAPTKAKRKSAPASHKRNPEGVSRVWGSVDVSKSTKGGGNGKNDSSPQRKRNSAPAEDSAEVREANELLLRVWKNIHAKRDRFGKFD